IQAVIFSKAASGVLKSIATSIFENYASRLSMSTFATMLWFLCRAISSIILPIFPYPNKPIFIS
ncbi:MAG: hypothetical protein KJO53_07980, partial [Eudoraea sp.]|nr:hypothetical protein [Eudoraea sp.]